MRDLVRFGVPEAQARAYVGAPPARTVFAVWRQHRIAVEVFLALAGSWRYVPMGPAVGIERAEIVPTLMLMGVRRRQWPVLFAQLREMERAALGVFRDQA